MLLKFVILNWLRSSNQLILISLYIPIKWKKSFITSSFLKFGFVGIDASIRPFLSNIAQSKIDGRSLFVIDDEFLQQIGISIFGVRHILLQAVGLLRHLVTFFRLIFGSNIFLK